MKIDEFVVSIKIEDILTSEDIEELKTIINDRNRYREALEIIACTCPTNGLLDPKATLTNVVACAKRAIRINLP